MKVSNLHKDSESLTQIQDIHGNKVHEGSQWWDVKKKNPVLHTII